MAFEKVSKSSLKNSQTEQSSSGLTSRPFAPPAKQVTQIPTVQLSSSDQTGQQQEVVNNDLKTNRRTNLVGIPIFPPHSNRESPRIQPKLTIGHTGDNYEEEANRVTVRVVQDLNIIPSQSVSISQPKSEFASSQVLQRAASNGQIEMQTDEFGLMQERKVPFIEGEGLYKDHKISQTQPKMIQRTTDTEVREELLDDEDHLTVENYENWLRSCGAGTEESLRDILLDPLTIDDVNEKLEYYEMRLDEQEEEGKWEEFIPDRTAIALQWDTALVNSPTFGQYIQPRQQERVNSYDNIHVVEENHFIEIYAWECLQNYNENGDSSILDDHAKEQIQAFREEGKDDDFLFSYFKVKAAQADGEELSGFSSLFDEKAIYLRKSMPGNPRELYLHEIIHRYSKTALSNYLGSSINEGITEIFMRLLLAENNITAMDRSYQDEVNMVNKLITVFFNGDLTLILDAYFNGNVEPVLAHIENHTSEDQYKILVEGDDTEQKMITLEQIEASQTNEPTSEESEQEADEQIEVPRRGKRKREEEEEEEDQDEIESQKHAPKYRKIEKKQKTKEE